MLVGGLVFAAAVANERQPLAAGTDVVLYATDAPTLRGNWVRTTDSTAAGGQRLASSDNGWSTVNGALGNPGDYFELAFSASANTAYRVWLRLRASGNSKYNDSAYVQFSDSVDSNGSAIYRTGTTSSLTVNLQSCNGCAMSGWGWLNNAYWLDQATTVRFANSGTHTLRVQTREDGVSIDQIVLSPSTYLSSAPGQLTNDSTIVAKTSSAPPSSGGGAYGGSPVSLPGTVQAADYDLGGEGLGYHDASSGNSGGSYRSDNVDIEPASDGGYNVGWSSAGEWLNYSVTPGAAGSYTAEVRVASPNGGQMHIGFNGASGVWTSVSVPATGGWQNWTSVNVPVTLAAGSQVMTMMFDTGGINLRYVKLTSASSAPSTPAPAPPAGGVTPYTGSPAAVPGTISAANFDNGGEGVAYHDTTSGNSGGALRSTNVDLESCTEGGYDIGWTASGEWVNYTVNVASSGSYTAQLRVASVNGATLHLGFNASSGVWTSVNVPATGDWQSWTTVNVPVTLGAGTQQMTIAFDTGGVNLAYVKVVAGAAPSSTPTPTPTPTPPAPAPPPSPPSSVGTTVSAVTWNIEINDNTESHARVAMDNLLAIGPRPEIIVIQEAYSGYYNIYLDELQRQTGKTWYGAFATHCASGDWNGSSCRNSWYQGIGIFSIYPITSSASMLFPYADCWTSARAGLRAAVSVNGVTVQVFATHLQTGGCSDSQQARYSSMSKLKSWSANFSGPQIAAGDFNADPDQIDTTAGMRPNFVDTWGLVGSGRGLSAFGPDPSMKIDYWFSDVSGRVIPQSTQVIYWTGSISDHYPVQTTFVIK